MLGCAFFTVPFTDTVPPICPISRVLAKSPLILSPRDITNSGLPCSPTVRFPFVTLAGLLATT
jgi:hypothetical protein